MSTAYRQLEAVFSQYQANAEEIDRLLGIKWSCGEGQEEWIDATSERIAALRNAQITLMVSPENNVGNLLRQAVQESAGLTPWQQANLREMQRIYSYNRGMKNPEIKELVTSLEEAAKNAETFWEKTHEVKKTKGAQEAFAMQKPVLEHIFGLRREIARYVAADQGRKVSEAVIGEWNHYASADDINRVFSAIKEKLPDIIKDVQARLANKAPPLPLENVPVEKQMALFDELKAVMLAQGGWTPEEMTKQGVSIEMGATENGFNAGSRREIRVAVEVRENNFIAGLKNTLHEMGHTLVVLQANRAPDEVRDQPVSWVGSKDVHESVAIFLEKMTHSRQFYELLTPLIQKHMGVGGPAWSPDNLQKLATRPDFENMYWYGNEMALPPQIAFRVMAEQKILDGEMEVADLPQFWAQTMEDFTGLKHKPEDFFVEESHWFDVYAGYFWAYQAAEIVAVKERSKVLRNDQEISHSESLGEYVGHFIKAAEKDLYGQGALYTPAEIFHKATGNPARLDDYFIHLRSLATGEINLTHGEFNPAAENTSSGADNDNRPKPIRFPGFGGSTGT